MGIAVGIINSLQLRTLHKIVERCIDISLLCDEIAPQVVFVRIRGIIAVSVSVVKVLPYELVGLVILIRKLDGGICKCPAPTPDLRDVPVPIVGVIVRGVGAVLICRDESCLRAVRAGDIGQCGFEYQRVPVLELSG